jgi:hypothetical protein
MSSLPASIGLCWAIGLGVAAVLLACAAVNLLLYVSSAFIIGLVGRLMRLGQKEAPRRARCEQVAGRGG